MPRECDHERTRYEHRTVTLRVFVEEVCAQCGAEDWTDAEADDLLMSAYRVYRQRHGLLMPEEVFTRRILNGWSQNDLDQALGWHAGTVAAFERGALQTKEHDDALRSALGLVRLDIPGFLQWSGPAGIASTSGTPLSRMDVEVKSGAVILASR